MSLAQGVPGPYLYTLAALVGLVVLLALVLAAALWRLSVAVRQARQPEVGGQSAAVFVAGAVHDALLRLKAQEQALQARAEASERLSDAILAGMSSGLLVVDSAGLVRIVNPAGRRLLGLQDDVAGGPYRTLLAHVPALVDVVAQSLATSQPLLRRTLQVTVPDAHQEGRAATRWLGVSVSPLQDAATRLDGVICLFTDLTAVVTLEEQVRLKEGLAQLGELTAGLAHEFRNGLATIHGYARMLDPSRLPAPYDTYVTELRKESEGLGEMVSRFLAFARPLPLAPAPVPLEALVARVVRDYSVEAERLGGAVEARGDFATVLGDEVMLRQALGNLCRNALEACAVVGRAPLVTVEGRVEPWSGTQVIRVTDNGPGVPTDLAGRIFQPFVTGKATGAGLGLALVRKIIVLHNGRIRLETVAPEGATFEIRLPTASDPDRTVHGKPA